MPAITLPRQIAYPIRDKRKQLGLTQVDLAQKAGVSRQLVVSLEAGRATGVSLDKLMSVLDVLGLSLSINEAQEESVEQAINRQKNDEYREAFNRAAAKYKMRSSLFPGISIFPGEDTFPGGKNGE